MCLNSLLFQESHFPHSTNPTTTTTIIIWNGRAVCNPSRTISARNVPENGAARPAASKTSTRVCRHLRPRTQSTSSDPPSPPSTSSLRSFSPSSVYVHHPDSSSIPFQDVPFLHSVPLLFLSFLGAFLTLNESFPSCRFPFRNPRICDICRPKSLNSICILVVSPASLSIYISNKRNNVSV